MSHEHPTLSRTSAPPPQLARSETEESQRDGFSSRRLQRTSTYSDLTRESLRAYLEKRGAGLQRSSVRAAHELARRSEHPLACTVSVRLTERKTGGHVYYKYDGSRFQHADATVKVVKGITYDVHVVVKPSIDIVGNVLYFRSMTAPDEERSSVIYVDKNRKDSKELLGTWKCDYEIGKKGQRSEVVITGHLAHFGEFAVPVMTKVYAQGQKHAVQGFKLRWVVFELKRKQDIHTGMCQLDSVRYMS